MKKAALKITRAGRLLCLKHPAFEAAWDLKRGGILVRLHDCRRQCTILDARRGGPAPDVIIAASATLEEKEHELRLSQMGEADVGVFLSADGRQVRIELAAECAEVRVERTLTVSTKSAWIEEKIALRNLSDHDLLIDRYPDWESAGKTAVAGDLYHWTVNPGGVDYVLAGLRVGGDYANTEYVTPACGYPFFYNRGHFAEMDKTAITLVAGHHGAVLPCIMAYNDKTQSGVLLSCLHDRCLRYVRMYSDPKAKTGTITAQVWWARWLSPGERREVATWHLVPFAGDYGPMLDEYRHRLADTYGIKPPTKVCADIDDTFVACFHPILLNGLGHMDALQPYVDRAVEVGATALWISGTWLDASDIEPKAVKSRCMPQTRDGVYGVTTRYGGPEARARLVDYIHGKGLKFAVWITGYGLTGHDPMYEAHPEVFVRLRRPVHLSTDSNPSWPGYDMTVGRMDPWIYPPFGGSTIGGDTTNAIWRQFWLKNQEYWAARGVDGVFFDSFNPMPPNYALRPWPGQISLEIINLQREARRRAQAVNPKFFTFTEGGGYLMATVNDFTHTWPGSDAPPLPPFRKRPLTPEEEARFLRDEGLSMIPGARAWASVADSGDNQGGTVSQSRPRVLYNFFSGRMPMLGMYSIGSQPEPIKNETDYWAYWKPYPADRPHPVESEHWKRVKTLWKLRTAHPELKSGRLDFQSVTIDDPAVFAFLRIQGQHASVVVLNFRQECVSCRVRVDWRAAGFKPKAKTTPRDLLHDMILDRVQASQWSRGVAVTVAARDGVLLKLQ